MKDLAEEQGFVPAAAVAAAAEHSIMRQYAEGRPNSRDQSELTDFAVKIREKIQQTEDIEGMTELSVKGNRPYREYNGVPMKPSAGKQCKKCGLCSRSLSGRRHTRRASGRDTEGNMYLLYAVHRRLSGTREESQQTGAHGSICETEKRVQ